LRTAFIEALTRAAGRDPRVCLVVADLGFGVIDNFARSYPKQFVNVGVAEQNMMGVAAGMALSGKTVFTYSIANFATLRCVEQIRSDVCYQRANVRVVSVGGGVAYGNLGVSHHATEDLAIMRSLSGMLVIAPGDPVETIAATEALIEYQGPAYLRLGRAGERVVHTSPPDFRLGRAITVHDGGAVTLISTGGMLATAMDAAARLAQLDLQVRVLSMHTLSPLDTDAVTAAAFETRQIFTLEEHSLTGGLGSAVAEVLSEIDDPHAPLKRIAFPAAFNREVGDQEHLRRLHGLDVDGVAGVILATAERSKRVVG
jgi:transketolase